MWNHIRLNTINSGICKQLHEKIWHYIHKQKTVQEAFSPLFKIPIAKNNFDAKFDNLSNGGEILIDQINLGPQNRTVFSCYLQYHPVVNSSSQHYRIITKSVPHESSFPRLQKSAQRFCPKFIQKSYDHKKHFRLFSCQYTFTSIDMQHGMILHFKKKFINF